jgi:hypothetical protein
MPPAPPLVSDADRPGANPLHRSLVAASCEVDGAVLLAVVPPWRAVARCVAATTGDEEATGVAATTELGTAALGAADTTGAEVTGAVAAGAVACTALDVELALRWTFGAANEGEVPEDVAGVEERGTDWLATEGPDAAAGVPTVKDAGAVPPVGLLALMT